MSNGSVIVIGAGPAGLTAAYLLAKAGVTVTVLEGDPQYVGGISKTVQYQGYHFDIGGHRFFSKSKEVEDFWTEILPDDMLDRPRSSRILYRGRFFAYPLKAKEALLKLGIFESVRCVLSYAWARLSPIPQPRSFEEWVSNQFGRRLFEIFFKTYTEKVWGTPCSEISADWAAQRIKGLSLSTAIINALLPKRKPKARGAVVKTLIDSFRYPRRGPGMLWERCVERLEGLGGRVRMGRKVTRCVYDEAEQKWTVTATDGEGREETLTGAHLISSTPIRELVPMLQPPVNTVASAAAQELKYRDFITVAVILKERHLFDDNWIYVHDPTVQVGRIQNFKSWSPEMVPDPEMACYGLEYFCFEGRDGLWAMADEDLKALAGKELTQLGLASPGDIVDACVVRQRKAYPVYDDAYAEHVLAVRTELEARFPTLQLVGRNGMHKYNNQDHSMMTAMLAVKNILAGRRQYDLWAVNEDAEYHESGERGASPTGLRDVPRPPAPLEQARPMGLRSFAWALAVFLLLAGLALPFVLTLGVTQGLTHDEHQHVAAGAILAREGLFPYKDYPSFHTPYLPFIYALIFKWTDHLLLGARLFSVACATASVALVGTVAAWIFRPRGWGASALAAVAAVGLALSASVFTETAGHAWNQEPAVLAALVAFLVHLHGVRRTQWGWLLASGLLLGLAVGLRITFAPLVGAFGLALLVAPETRGRRIALLSSFAGGVTVGLAGLFAMFVAAPEQAYFGNWEFAKANIDYRLATGEPRTMTLLKKLRYLVKVIMRPDAGLALAFGISLAAALAAVRAARERMPLALRFLLISVPFLLIGSLAPSPVFEQYFYPFALFLPLGAIYALATIPAGRTFVWGTRGALAAVVLSLGMGARQYENLEELPRISSWDPVRLHDQGVAITSKVPAGEILTLAPIYALEGGRSIYPALVTGPFAWRVSPYVEAGKASRLKMLTPATLDATLKANAPEGILLGLEKRGEEELAQYAQRNHYQMVKRFEKAQLWVQARQP